MKKLIYFICLITLCLLSGCDITPTPNPTPTPIPGEDEVSDENIEIIFDTSGGTNIAIQIITKGSKAFKPLDPDKEDYRFLGWSQGDNSYFDFDTVLYENTIIYAVWESMYKDYSEFLDLYLPDVISTNVELETRVGDLRLMWKSSNPNVLDNYGNLSRPRHDEIINVTLTVYDEGYLTTYNKDVKVLGVEYKDLVDGNIAIGYYSSWNFFGYTDEMYDTLDIVNLCFAYVTPDCGLNISGLQSYIPKILQAHNAGIRVLLSVQGYSSEGANFSLAASTASGRKKLANAMLEFVETYNFDGIDIDWEYPGFNTGRSTAVDRENYTLLMKEIYTTLKNKDDTYLLTAAIPGGPYLPSRFDLENTSKYLDYINIMTYDLNASGKCVHHTALYSGTGTASNCSIDYSVNYYLDAKVPKSKIIIGIAFYGKSTKGNTLAGSGSSYSSITYTKIYQNYILPGSSNVKFYYDEECQAPYIVDTINNIFITYDNERSIKAKVDYVKDKKLGGVMIWEIGEDMTLNLLKSLYNVYKK